MTAPTGLPPLRTRPLDQGCEIWVSDPPVAVWSTRQRDSSVSPAATDHRGDRVPHGIVPLPGRAARLKEREQLLVAPRQIETKAAPAPTVVCLGACRRVQAEDRRCPVLVWPPLNEDRYRLYRVSTPILGLRRVIDGPGQAHHMARRLYGVTAQALL